MKDYFKLSSANLIIYSFLLCSNFYFSAYTDNFFPININLKFIELLILFFCSLLFFSIFFFYFQKIPPNSIIYKLTAILFLTWISVQALQTLFFMSNTLTLSAFISKYLFFSSDILNNVFLRVFRFFLPYLLFAIFFYYFYDHFGKIIEFIKVLSIIFFVFIIYNEVSLFKHFQTKNQKTINLIDNKQEKNNFKVLWFLFDEFDPELAGQYSKLMPNFQRIKKNSFEHKNFYSPAKKTNVSVPSQLMGIAPIGTLVKDRKYYLIDQSGVSKEFKFENTLFNSLLEKKIFSSIHSSFFPYCKIYLKKNLLQECVDPKLDDRTFIEILYRPFYENFRGPIFIFSPIGKINFALNILIKKNKKKLEASSFKISEDELNKIFKSKLNENNLEDVDGFNLVFFESIKKVLSDENNTSFGFFHLMLPHLPSDHAQKKLNLSFNSLNKPMAQWENSDHLLSYLINLKYTDFVIKKINQISNNYKDKKNVIIIFSSDHWFRQKNLKDDTQSYPSLLVINFLKDKSKITYDKKSSGNHLSELIKKIFNEDIKSHKDIENFFDRKDYNEPCKAIECLEGQKNFWKN